MEEKKSNGLLRELLEAMNCNLYTIAAELVAIHALLEQKQEE